MADYKQTHFQWSATFHNREAEDTGGSETNGESEILPRNGGMDGVTWRRAAISGSEQAFPWLTLG